MVMHGRAWSCMVVHGHAWLCMVQVAGHCRFGNKSRALVHPHKGSLVKLVRLLVAVRIQVGQHTGWQPSREALIGRHPYDDFLGHDTQIDSETLTMSNAADCCAGT